jgi:hypothetical protein
MYDHYSAECMIDLANDGFTKEQVLDALRVLPLVSNQGFIFGTETPLTIILYFCIYL